MSFAKTLTRDEMKKITAGDSGCHVACCSGPNSCSDLVHCSECDASTASGCQQQAISEGYTCINDDQYISGYYYPQEA